MNAMLRVIVKALLAVCAFVVGGLLCAMLVNADEAQRAQFLMVDEEGNISPQGYTLGIDQIAAAAAETAAASNRVAAVAQATAESAAIVSNLTEVLVGNVSFGYIDGFVVSLGGAAAVSSNATCRIVRFDVAQESKTTGGVAYSGHHIYYYYSEPMNSVPYIKWKTALTDEEWTVAEQDGAVSYGTATLDGVTYENLYRSTAWTPSSLDRAFYMAYCEVSTPEGDGSLFPIWGGITINGQSGFTGAITNETAVFTYQGGLLMGITQ